MATLNKSIGRAEVPGIRIKGQAGGTTAGGEGDMASQPITRDKFTQGLLSWYQLKTTI